MTDLKVIPGIGKNMERHLKAVGIHCVEDLAGKDPEKIYAQDCIAQNAQVDRCALYVYRMAVYYANNEERDPALLKWWLWKDEALEQGK